MDKTLHKVTRHEEARAETYRYWRGRSDAEVWDAIAEMSEQAWNAWYQMKGIPPLVKNQTDLLRAFNTARVRHLTIP